jgi:hypothetical protein
MSEVEPQRQYSVEELDILHTYVGLGEFWQASEARAQAVQREGCGCGERPCPHFDAGYPLCKHCQDHHREWPQCPGVVVLDDGTVEDAEPTEAQNADSWKVLYSDA